MDQFCLFRLGERGYVALGTVISENSTQFEFRTLNNDIIIVKATEGELNRFNDQGFPAEVDVSVNGESVIAGMGYYLPLALGVFLVIEEHSKNKGSRMAEWESEQVLNKWLQKEAESKQYVEDHATEMGGEIDEAFHRDIIALLEKHGVDTAALITVDILKALERLILDNGAKAKEPQRAWPENWGGEKSRKAVKEFSNDYAFKEPYNEYINLVGVTKEGDEWAILVGLKKPFPDDIKLPETHKGFRVIVKVMGEIVPL